MGSQELVWGKFCGIFGALLALVGIAVVAAWAEQAQLTYPPTGRSPHHDWEPLLVRQGIAAFRQLAAGRR